MFKYFIDIGRKYDIKSEVDDFTAYLVRDKSGDSFTDISTCNLIIKSNAYERILLNKYVDVKLSNAFDCIKQIHGVVEELQYGKICYIKDMLIFYISAVDTQTTKKYDFKFICRRSDKGNTTIMNCYFLPDSDVRRNCIEAEYYDLRIELNNNKFVFTRDTLLLDIQYEDVLSLREEAQVWIENFLK